MQANAVVQDRHIKQILEVLSFLLLISFGWDLFMFLFEDVYELLSVFSMPISLVLSFL